MSSTSPPESKSKLSADDLATLVSTLQSEMLGIKIRLTESETRNDSLQETIVNLAHDSFPPTFIPAFARFTADVGGRAAINERPHIQREQQQP